MSCLVDSILCAEQTPRASLYSQGGKLLCADALAASQNPPPLDDQALMAEAAEQMQQSPAAGAAAMGAASIGVSEAAAQIGGESFMGIPAGAPMTISALPLAGQAGAGSMHVLYGTCNAVVLASVLR